jgi:hypothetical protein
MGRKFAAQRTPQLEKIVQELWALRPELTGKNSVTILLSLGAFLRECKGKTSSSFSTDNADLDLPKPQSVISGATAEMTSSVSDDIEWN